jgi:hypothetical protein
MLQSLHRYTPKICLGRLALLNGKNSKAVSVSTLKSHSVIARTRDIGFATVTFPTDGSNYVNAFETKDRYQWDDPLLLRAQLTEEERTIQDAAHEFCQGVLMPLILHANRHEVTLDHDLMRQMGQVGLLGATLPEKYGGSGLGYVRNSGSFGSFRNTLRRWQSLFLYRFGANTVLSTSFATTGKLRATSNRSRASGLLL